MNLCAAEERIRNFALDIFMDDLYRMEYTPGHLYNLHPGSHVGQGVEKGIEWIVKALDTAMTKEQTTLCSWKRWPEKALKSAGLLKNCAPL